NPPRQLKFNCRPPCDNTTAGPPPPPENCRPTTEATGATDPSGPTRKRVSTGAHEPSSSRTRTGSSEISVVNDPLGLANVCLVPPRRPTPATRRPAARADAIADASDPDTPAAADGAAGAAG